MRLHFFGPGGRICKIIKYVEQIIRQRKLEKSLM